MRCGRTFFIISQGVRAHMATLPTPARDRQHDSSTPSCLCFPPCWPLSRYQRPAAANRIPAKFVSHLFPILQSPHSPTSHFVWFPNMPTPLHSPYSSPPSDFYNSGPPAPATAALPPATSENIVPGPLVFFPTTCFLGGGSR